MDHRLPGQAGPDDAEGHLRGQGGRQVRQQHGLPRQNRQTVGRRHAPLVAPQGLLPGARPVGRPRHGRRRRQVRGVSLSSPPPPFSLFPSQNCCHCASLVGLTDCMGFTQFGIGSHRFPLVVFFLPISTREAKYYWVLLGFTGFYWVLLGFTGRLSSSMQKSVLF